jgi:hypothetical protein
MHLPKLYKKKDCIRLTWFSYLILIFVFGVGIKIVANSLYDFLSPIEKTSSKVLVIEGWIDDFAVEVAYGIYKNEQYDLIITTGGPLEIGYLATHFVSTANLCKQTFICLGMDSNQIISVPRDHTLDERTYHSAIALKDWLKVNRPDIENFNLVSLGPHSRRSWFLFQKAMPEKVIGIIAIRDKRFSAKQWWKSSKGTRTILTETIGYFYVLFFM